MNGIMEQRNYTKFICGCILILGMACIAGGCILIWKEKSGDILFTGAIAAISGLTGLLSQSKSPLPSQDISISANPTELKVAQPKTEPAIE